MTLRSLLAFLNFSCENTSIATRRILHEVLHSHFVISGFFLEVFVSGSSCSPCRMISLTIVYVCGIVAANIFILQFLLPNALIVVLVGLLKSEHTAVTWSVIERNQLNSMW